MVPTPPKDLQYQMQWPFIVDYPPYFHFRESMKHSGYYKSEEFQKLCKRLSDIARDSKPSSIPFYQENSKTREQITKDGSISLSLMLTELSTPSKDVRLVQSKNRNVTSPSSSMNPHLVFGDWTKLTLEEESTFTKE